MIPSAPSERERKSRSRMNQFPVKWVVFGVLALAFMVLFRNELGGLLERTSNLEITKEGLVIKAEVKTVQTPMGKTEVSVVSTTPEPQQDTGIYGNTYIDTQYDFKISWPDTRNWTADQTVGRQMLQNMGLPATVDIPIAIMANEVVDNVRPNVNVVVEKVGSMSVQDYVDQSERSLTAQGWEVLSTSTDPETEGGVIVMTTSLFGNELYQFQRIAMAQGNAYVITASQVPRGDDLTQGLRDDLASIINSFRIIRPE